MTITIVQHIAVSGFTSPLSASFAATPAVGHTVVVFVQGRDANTFTASDNQSGNTYASDLDWTGWAHVAVFRTLVVGASGTFTVTINSAAATLNTLHLVELSGTGIRVDRSHIAIGTADAVSSGNTAAVRTGMTFGMETHPNLSVPVVTGGYTSLDTVANNATTNLSSLANMPGAQIATWTVTGATNWMASVLVYVEGAGAPQTAAVTDFAFIDTQPREYVNLRTLGTPTLRVSMRISEFDINAAQISNYGTAAMPYYFTAASSDFVVGGHPLYETIADLTTILNRSDCAGLYMHEVVTYLASTHTYNWPLGLADLDWNWVDAVVALCVAARKPLVWSEAAEGWPTMYTDATANAHLATYSNTILIPTYATNFAPHSLLDDAEAGAKAVAIAYGTRLGMSHQIWYWLDNNEHVTPALSTALIQRGLGQGATFIQGEGPQPYMSWEGNYILGFRNYAGSLLPTVAYSGFTGRSAALSEWSAFIKGIRR